MTVLSPLGAQPAEPTLVSGAAVRPAALSMWQQPLENPVDPGAPTDPLLVPTLPLQQLQQPAADPGSRARASWFAPLASALVPGAGQFLLGQQRSAAYAAAELYLLIQYIGARRDGNRDREAYRSLAAEVARQQFGGSLPTGTWDYYEHLEHFLESGVYNRNPGGDLEPELDALTYNGNRWALARDIYWLDPQAEPDRQSAEYRNAIAFYENSAARDEFRWSWRDATLQQATYQNTIASANRNYQRSINFAGAIALTHLVSVIDAYVSVRVRRFGGAGLGPFSVQEVHAEYAPSGLGSGSPGTWLGYIRLGKALPRGLPKQ